MQNLEVIKEEDNQRRTNRGSFNLSNSAVNRRQDEIPTFQNLGEQQK